MKVSELYGKIRSLTEQELLQLNAAIVHELKHKRRARSAAAKSLFNIGDTVSFGEIGGRGKRAFKEGEVVAIKRTRAQIRVRGITWTVPLNMLKAV